MLLHFLVTNEFSDQDPVAIKTPKENPGGDTRELALIAGPGRGLHVHFGQKQKCESHGDRRDGRDCDFAVSLALSSLHPLSVLSWLFICLLLFI